MAVDVGTAPDLRGSTPRTSPDAWRTVRFDQMAQNIADRVDNPSEAGVDRYVGLEHLDPESLKIRRWGHPSDVEATKLRFKAGDIIFGRRRAYQRKLAVADFEGICSAHAMVLRAREDTVLKDFLPFFMQSDLFFNRALQISVGSLSPTINWSALARQEFTVPPLDEQRRIADILWAADEAIEHFLDCKSQADGLQETLLREIFTEHESVRKVPLGHVGQWFSGGTPARSCGEFWSGDIPWASPKDMKVDIVNATEETVSGEGVREGSRLVPAGTIFVVVRGMILAHTFPIALAGKPMAFNQDMKAMVVSPEFNNLFVFYWLKGKARHILGMVSDSSHGTKRLDSNDLFKLSVPCPAIDDQSRVVEVLQASDRAKLRIQEQYKQLRRLKKSLLRVLLAASEEHLGIH